MQESLIVYYTKTTSKGKKEYNINIIPIYII